MFIFNALGLKSVPFLKNIVPHILATVKNCGQHGLREALLQQVANLSAIVREHLRPYLPAIFDVVEEFWFTRHLSALCSSVEKVLPQLYLMTSGRMSLRWSGKRLLVLRQLI